MIFQSKFDKQIKRLREKNGGQPNDLSELPNVVEKGDVFALILSAMLTILPVCLIVLAVIVGIAYFLIV